MQLSGDQRWFAFSLLLASVAVAAKSKKDFVAPPRQPTQLHEGTIYSAPIGWSVTFRCNSTVTKWTHRAESVEPVVEYDPQSGYSCRGSYCRGDIAIGVGNSMTITILSLRMEHAGNYTCFNRTRAFGTIQLAVVNSSAFTLHATTDRGATPPLIEGRRAVTPDDAILLQCSLSYSGFFAPELGFLLYTEAVDSTVLYPANVEENTGMFHRNGKVSVTAQMTKSSHVETIVRCATVSAPDHPSEVFKLIDGPRFLDDRKQQTLNWSPGGVQLDCLSDSYPRALYEWTYVSGDEVNVLNENGPLHLATLLGQYWCSAKNAANNMTKKKTFIVVGT